MGFNAKLGIAEALVVVASSEPQFGFVLVVGDGVGYRVK